MFTKMIKNKRGGVSISVALFTLAVLSLTAYSLFVFMGEKNDVKKEIGPSLFFEDIYSKEIQLRVYVDSSINQSLKEMNLSNFTLEEFIRRFSDKMSSGRVYLPEVEQILNQVNNGIFYRNGVLEISFSIVLERSLFEKIDGKNEEVAKARHGFKINKSYQINKASIGSVT